jgi:hypothetical protein
MKIDRTKYTAHYENGVVVAQWVSVEMALDTANGESPLEALDRSQELVQQWYKSKNLPFETNSAPPGPPPVITIERTSEDKRIADLIRDMYTCTELGGDNGLMSYQKVAITNKEAGAVYDLMYKKLSKIISKTNIHDNNLD